MSDTIRLYELPVRPVFKLYMLSSFGYRRAARVCFWLAGAFLFIPSIVMLIITGFGSMSSDLAIAGAVGGIAIATILFIAGLGFRSFAPKSPDVQAAGSDERFKHTMGTAAVVFGILLWIGSGAAVAASESTILGYVWLFGIPAIAGIALLRSFQKAKRELPPVAQGGLTFWMRRYRWLLNVAIVIVCFLMFALVIRMI